ncbi:universal stress protein [Methanothermobacter wolfeii]|uniref:Universal stress protein n=1 Tax=Methanothermobacter wolfeii TaxID=145261 RepID=A0A9E7RTM6_METWO|nr:MULTISPECIES: universal stress protein [Methanothermobacter]NLM02746.1 universal stress protein [Methanothermobacter wolfeii]QHN06735.1 universal stress protein [Methanothermobacter sp. THM-1]UXH31277.1 universal stress protein [Methanothermobacter wolfeii]SCM57996.1 Universal stress protein MJ0531 [Methanothermobacter wolfeii]
MYSKILLPTDGSKHANKAAEHAIWIARKSGAEIIALTVMETSSLVSLPADDLIVRLKEMLEEEASRSLEAVKKLVEKSGAGVKITLRTDEGSPADAILRTIEKEEVDLVVMGTSGKHGLDRFLLGSVAEKVVRSAGCPVLVVH